MKRYRVLAFDFDSRASGLAEPQEGWEPKVKEQHLENREKLEASLVGQFGSLFAEQKLRNFAALGPLPMSVLKFHNTFHSDARNAFVVGAYYPALTGICALGERVLNHLILGLRDFYKATPEYKRVHNKDAFVDWPAVVKTLEAWGILQPEAITAFAQLERLRHRAIHFRPEVDTNDRELALEGIQLFTTIVQAQFGMFGQHPWFIPGAKGASFIKKEWESDPFVKLVYLPSCHRVGPDHRLEFRDEQFHLHDDGPYPEVEITDEEFIRLVGEAQRTPQPPSAGG